MRHKKIKVLIAKPGLDGHDRGAKIVARALRDAGMEVIYTGIRQTPEMIVQAALQEDVDVIGLSSLSGAHMELFGDVMAGLLKNKMTKVSVVAGGIIPIKDIPVLEKMGIKKVFGPGTKTGEIAEAIRELAAGTQNQ
jgi:methylmalonyl-CoA mutase C-terminal domain/subunit